MGRHSKTLLIGEKLHRRKQVISNVKGEQPRRAAAESWNVTDAAARLLARLDDHELRRRKVVESLNPDPNMMP